MILRYMSLLSTTKLVNKTKVLEKVLEEVKEKM